MFFYRDGRNYGNRAYYPATPRTPTPGEILAAFLAQFYAERVPARLVLLAEPVPEQALLAEALAVRAGRKVELLVPQRGDRRQLVEIALTNARQALARRLADTASQEALLEQLADRFDLPETPARIEVYDNSHIQGSNAIGAFIVAGPEGFDKRSYRTFNIKGGELAPGDDYAMMREVLRRRFARLIKEDPERARRRAGPIWWSSTAAPGQLAAALRPPWASSAWSTCRCSRWPRGPSATPARSGSSCPGREPLALDPRDPVLYFVQRLRDEAHRFAIQTHRGKRTRDIGRSVLDQVPGRRRQAQAGAAQPFRLGPRRVRGRACWTSSGCRGSIGRWRRRSMTSSTTAPEPGRMLTSTPNLLTVEPHRLHPGAGRHVLPRRRLGALGRLRDLRGRRDHRLCRRLPRPQLAAAVAVRPLARPGRRQAAGRLRPW